MNLKRLQHYFYVACIMILSSLPAISSSLPEQNIAGNPDITTIWVVGDKDIIARAFNAVAMFFGDGGWMGLLQLGALVALTMMLLSVVTKRNLDPFNYILMIIIIAAFFIPKTSVYVASYYDARGGTTGGAVGFKKVDNIPIGVAYPLGFMSSIAKSLTERYDTVMQVTPIPGTVDPQGGMLVHGAEGYFSPLKSVLRLRNQFSSPNNSLLLANLANASKLCNWSNRWEDAEKGGIFAVLANGKQGGMINFMFPGKNAGDKPIMLPVGCDVAGKTISLMMLDNVTNVQGRNYSESAIQATKSRSFANIGIGGQQKIIENTQKELDQLPNAIATTAGGNSISRVGGATTNPLAIIGQIRDQIMTTGSPKSSISESMQYFAAGNAIDAAQIEANMIFSRIVQACISTGDSECIRKSWLLTEGRNRAAVDTAGEASMFQNFMGHAMNILMFIYIVMCPIIIFVIMVRGWGGVKILGAYLLFAAWINSWLPLDNAIAYYQLQNYTDRVFDLINSLTATGDTARIYSPSVINALFDGAQDMIASASTMMSMVPIIMLSLLSGSIYGLVQVAQRAGMTGKDYIDEDKVVPKLDESEAIGMARMLDNSSKGGPVSSENMSSHLISNADGANPGKIKLNSSDAYGESLNEAYNATLSAVNKIGTTESTATISNEGIVSESGYVLTKNADGSVSLEHVEKGDSVKQFTDKGSLVVGLGANANAKLGVGTGDKTGFTAFAGVGGSAKISGSEDFSSSDSVKTTSSDGQTRSMSQSDSFASSQGIRTSFGNMDNHQIQQAIAEEKSDLRSKADALAQTANSMTQSGYGIDISTGNFASIIPPNNAQAEMQAGADAARLFSPEAANQLAMSSGNTAAYAQTLQQLSSGTEMDKRAALAAITAVTQNSPNGEAVSLQAAQILDDAGKVDHLRHSVMSSIESPIDGNRSSSLGQMSNPMNYDARAEQIRGANTPELNQTRQEIEGGRQNLGRQFDTFDKASTTLNQAREEAAQQTAMEGARNNISERTIAGYQVGKDEILQGNKHWEDGQYGQAIRSWASGASTFIPHPAGVSTAYTKGNEHTGTVDGAKFGKTFDEAGHNERESARETLHNMSFGGQNPSAIPTNPSNDSHNYIQQATGHRGDFNSTLDMVQKLKSSSEGDAETGLTANPKGLLFNTQDSVNFQGKNIAIQQTIAERWANAGLNPNIGVALAGIETGNSFNPMAYNRSGASGLFQFMPSNFESYGLKGREFDVNANIDAAIKMTKQNAAYFKNNVGREPTAGEVYLMHQQGAAGLAALAKEADGNNGSAASVLSYPKIKQNLPASMADQAKTISAGDFIRYWSQKMEKNYDKFN